VIGRVLGGRYAVEARVGGGGMATVYRGLDTLLNRPVALKVLRVQLASDPDFVRRFRREARAAASLSHPHIIAVYDVGSEGSDCHYIVQEYVDGETLKERISREGPLAPADALRVMGQVLDALGHAHRAGIVHRDVKPQNVLLARDGRVKVTDFGIALAEVPGGAERSYYIVGTAHYAAPEQVRGELTDARSDIYSAGVMFYEMLTGQLPFPGDRPVAVALQHVTAEAPDPGLVRPLPQGFSAVVARALRKAPEDRYGTAEAFRLDLEALAAGILPAPALAATGGGTGGDARMTAAAPSPPGGALGPGAVAAAAAPRVLPDRGAAALRSGRRSAPRGAVGTDVAELSHGGMDAATAQGRGPAPPPVEDGKWQADQGDGHPTAPRWLRWALPAAGACLLLLLIYAVGRHALSQAVASPRTVAVPAVVGEDAADAEAALRALGLTWSLTEEHTLLPAGEVARLTPPAGSVLRVGQGVQLVVSTGPGTVSLPNVIGLPKAQALAELRAAGLGVHLSPVSEFSPSIPAGSVVATVPQSGAVIAQGGAVLVVLSVGPRPLVALGDYVGDSERRTIAALERQRLAVGRVVGEPTGWPAGTVAATVPVAGARIPAGTAVDLLVSTGCLYSAPLPLTAAPAAATPATTTHAHGGKASPPRDQETVLVQDVGGVHARPIFHGTVAPGQRFVVQLCWSSPQGATWTWEENGAVRMVGHTGPAPATAASASGSKKTPGTPVASSAYGASSSSGTGSGTGSGASSSSGTGSGTGSGAASSSGTGSGTGSGASANSTAPHA
jgi:beta-lactam-binding protein with PASTA domain